MIRDTQHENCMVLRGRLIHKGALDVALAQIEYPTAVVLQKSFMVEGQRELRSLLFTHHMVAASCDDVCCVTRTAP